MQGVFLRRRAATALRVVVRSVMLRLAIYSAVTLALTTAEVVANNNLFLPGDAFYYTILADKELSELKHRDAYANHFLYPRMGAGAYMGAFGGYAGYGRAIIPAINRRFTENLAGACEQVLAFERTSKDNSLNDGNFIPTPKDAVRVFFVPTSFDLTRFHIGLRYNENWLEETLKFGYRHDQPRVCCFVHEADAIMESWRDSKLVAGLNVVLPDQSPAKHESVDEPLTIWTAPLFIEKVVIYCFN